MKVVLSIFLSVSVAAVALSSCATRADASPSVCGNEICETDEHAPDWSTLNCPRDCAKDLKKCQQKAKQLDAAVRKAKVCLKDTDCEWESDWSSNCTGINGARRPQLEAAMSRILPASGKGMQCLGMVLRGGNTNIRCSEHRTTCVNRCCTGL